MNRPNVTAIQVDTEGETVTFTVSRVTLTCDQCGAVISIPEGLGHTALALAAQAHTDTHRA